MHYICINKTSVRWLKTLGEIVDLNLFQWIRITDKKSTVLDLNLVLYFRTNYSSQDYFKCCLRLVNSLSSATLDLSPYLLNATVLLHGNDCYSRLNSVTHKMICRYSHNCRVLQF